MLDPNDKDVINAEALEHIWGKQREAETKKLGTPEAEAEYSFERSTVYFDAGFDDPDYLDQVADWLAQDLKEAQDKGLTEIAAKIQAKIDEINSKTA